MSSSRSQTTCANARQRRIPTFEKKADDTKRKEAKGLTCHKTSCGKHSSIAPPCPELLPCSSPALPPADLPLVPDPPKSRRRVFCLERKRSVCASVSLRRFCRRLSSLFTACRSCRKTTKGRTSFEDRCIGIPRKKRRRT